MHRGTLCDFFAYYNIPRRPIRQNNKTESAISAEFAQIFTECAPNRQMTKDLVKRAKNYSVFFRIVRNICDKTISYGPRNHKTDNGALRN